MTYKEELVLAIFKELMSRDLNISIDSIKSNLDKAIRIVNEINK